MALLIHVLGNLLNVQDARKSLTVQLCIMLRCPPMSKLKEVLRSLPPAELARVAREAETKPEYLTEQVANGHRKASVRLAKRLVKALPDRLTLADVRPDIYAEAA